MRQWLERKYQLWYIIWRVIYPPDNLFRRQDVPAGASRKPTPVRGNDRQIIMFVFGRYRIPGYFSVQDGGSHGVIIPDFLAKRVSPQPLTNVKL